MTVTSPPDETKATYGARISGFGAAGRVAILGNGAGRLIRDGFQANPIGFRAVRLIAEAAAALPTILRDGEAVLSVHPLLTLLARPNPRMSGSEFLEHVFGQLILTGNAYIEASAGAEDMPAALHSLRSDQVHIVTDAAGWPVAFEHRAGLHARRIPLDEEAPAICHIRMFHPQDDLYGMSPLQAASTAVGVFNGAAKWSQSLLTNAARPSGAIIYKGTAGSETLTQTQFERLQFEMESLHQGAGNAGRPLLLEGGLDWKPMGFSPSDMEFHTTKTSAARDIATAFGVPPMLLGIPGDATYANYQEANRAFYRLTVLPLAEKVFGALTHWLAPEERLRLVPDADGITALAPEREARWRAISQADFLTRSEKRALLGLPAEEEPLDA